MSAEIIIPALVLGAVSSLHCIGMCGPLAMSLPLGEKNSSKFTGALLYNFGRMTTYATLGLFFGLVGRSFALFGWQQKLSIAMGILILVLLVIPKLLNTKNEFARWNTKLMTSLRASLSKLLYKGNPGSLYAIGLLNGLLPCSMVYLALAGSVATGDAVNGALFMAVFGAGTIPAMWTISFFGGLMKNSLKFKMKNLYPAMMMIMAMLLIMRGLNLGIPFVSPTLRASSNMVLECKK